MPLSYVLDGDSRGLLWRHIQRHNARGMHPLDVTRVGDTPDLPFESEDAAVLLGAGRMGRIVVSRDRATLATELQRHIAGGHSSPGVFITRVVPYQSILDFLVCAAYASEPEEWRNRFVFIP